MTFLGDVRRNNMDSFGCVCILHIALSKGRHRWQLYDRCSPWLIFPEDRRDSDPANLDFSP